MQKAAPLSLHTKLALIITMIFWSSAFVGIRAGLEGYSPGALALFRFLVASLCMLILYVRLPADRPRVSHIDKIKLLLIGVLTLSTYHVFLNYGEISVSSGIASFIISQSPVITTVFAIFFLKERINIIGILGMVISIVGVTVIMLGQDGEFKFDLGNSFVLLSAVLGSLFAVVQKPFLKKYHGTDVTAYGMWGCALGLVFYFPALSHDIRHASTIATFSAVYLGIFPAALAYLAWSHILTVMPASRAANFLYFMPLLATLLGWFFLGEIPLWSSLAGGVVALIGLWVLNESYRWRLLGKNIIVEPS